MYRVPQTFNVDSSIFRVDVLANKQYKLVVNFDRALITLSKEVRNLTRLGQKVPYEIKVRLMVPYEIKVRLMVAQGALRDQGACDKEARHVCRCKNKPLRRCAWSPNNGSLISRSLNYVAVFIKFHLSPCGSLPLDK